MIHRTSYYCMPYNMQMHAYKNSWLLLLLRIGMERCRLFMWIEMWIEMQPCRLKYSIKTRWLRSPIICQSTLMVARSLKLTFEWNYVSLLLFAVQHTVCKSNEIKPCLTPVSPPESGTNDIKFFHHYSNMLYLIEIYYIITSHCNY